MTTSVMSRLGFILLAAAWASAGCSEQHAPAATSSTSGDALSKAQSPVAPTPQETIATGAAKQGATGAGASPDVKRDPEKSPTTAAGPSRRPLVAANNTAVATTSSRLPSGAGGMSNVTFDTIKFEMEKTQPFKPEMLTLAIRALEGKRLRISGYILPSFQQSGITQFVLVRDNMQCCFGPGAALYDCIVVDMAPGKSTEFKVTPVTVDGTFSVNELLDPETGKHLAVFHLTGELVK